MNIKVTFMMKKDPCYGCTPETGRSATCHGVCPGYLDWKKNHEAYNEYVRKQRQSEDNTIKDILNNKEYMRKKYGR